MKFTYYGHSTFLIEINDAMILTDPFITGNGMASEVDIAAINPNYILVSHAHQDHILDVEQIAKQSGALVVANYEVASHFGNKGLTVHHLNQGGTASFDFGSVKAFGAIHSSSFPDGSYGGNPLSFLITSHEGNCYFAADTSLTMDMKLVPMFADLNVAILPIGGTFTMDVKEAIMASTFLACDQIIGMHYNTFPPIEIDTKDGVEEFKKMNKTLRIMDIGESISI